MVASVHVVTRSTWGLADSGIIHRNRSWNAHSGGKVLFYLGILFSQTATRLKGKTCYIQRAYWKTVFWTVSLPPWVTLGPCEFSATETLCRDLFVRLQTSENQIRAKLMTTCSWKNLAFLLVVCRSQIALEVKMDSAMKGLLWDTSEVALLSNSLTCINVTLPLFLKKCSM